MFVSTAGQKTVNQSHITTLLLTLPPFSEQKRIVKKYNQLMGLCDVLELHVESSSKRQGELLEAVVGQV